LTSRPAMVFTLIMNTVVRKARLWWRTS
jgi:hypothetical protein